MRSEKALKMFALSCKEHDMGTRNEEKFKVQHAKTSRLKNFAQIYMQNMLNENEKS